VQRPPFRDPAAMMSFGIQHGLTPSQAMAAKSERPHSLDLENCKIANAPSSPKEGAGVNRIAVNIVAASRSRGR
jgi:hypothetical protein